VYSEWIQPAPFLSQVVKKLDEKEMTVLMVLATSVPELNAYQLRVQVSSIRKRAVTLSTLYMQTYSSVRWVMDACGLRVSAKWVGILHIALN